MPVPDCDVVDADAIFLMWLDSVAAGVGVLEASVKWCFWAQRELRKTVKY